MIDGDGVFDVLHLMIPTTVCAEQKKNEKILSTALDHGHPNYSVVHAITTVYVIHRLGMPVGTVVEDKPSKI